jgi:hypothetical protein
VRYRGSSEGTEAVGNRRRASERNRTKPAVIGGMIAVVVGGAGFGVYALYGGGAAADDSSSASDAKPVKKGPLSATEVKSTATAFLTAWQSGDVTAAAAATNDTAAARTLLTGYGKEAYIKDVTVTAKKRSSGSAPVTPSRSPSRARSRTRA